MPAKRDCVLSIGSLAVFVGGALAVRRPSVTRAELRCFQVVNGLSHRGYHAIWPPMQLGSVGGPLAVGAVAALRGRRNLGLRTAAVGTFTWVAARAVKPAVRRGRPAVAVSAARVLGQEQAGLGYPSGHAAVAAATAAVVVPHLPRRWRRPAWALALAVGPMRTYVGAHLPLDVVGGIALGTAIGTGTRSSTRRG